MTRKQISYHYLNQLKQDDFDAAALIRSQRHRNMSAIFLLGLSLGLALGYAWRMKQTTGEVKDIIQAQTFVPYDCIVPEFLLSQKVPHKSVKRMKINKSRKG